MSQTSRRTERVRDTSHNPIRLIGECNHLMWDECEILAINRLTHKFRLSYHCSECNDWVGVKRNATLADIAAGYGIDRPADTETLF